MVRFRFLSVFRNTKQGAHSFLELQRCQTDWLGGWGRFRLFCVFRAFRCHMLRCTLTVVMPRDFATESCCATHRGSHRVRSEGLGRRRHATGATVVWLRFLKAFFRSLRPGCGGIGRHTGFGFRLLLPGGNCEFESRRPDITHDHVEGARQGCGIEGLAPSPAGSTPAGSTSTPTFKHTSHKSRNPLMRLNMRVTMQGLERAHRILSY